ncbi:hypothetical protein MP228_000460 [Amoeboaphelidium protococcarum]|nr:hypothetical protein MP228_000460 [Amoeboaphelidium protococcarum]
MEETRLNDEMMALEAANVHAIIQVEEQSQEMFNKLKDSLEKVSLLETMLLGFHTELQTMGKGIRMIEQQNRGLQSQNANQRSLLKQLKSIHESTEVSDDVIRCIQHDSLETYVGITNLEHATSVLQQKLHMKLDPVAASLRAVNERIGYYSQLAAQFSGRLCDYMKDQVGYNVDLLVPGDGDTISGSNKSNRKKSQLSPSIPYHESFIKFLFQYRKLLYWLKDVDPRQHNELLMAYVSIVNRLYRKDVREYIDTLKVYTKRDLDEQAGMLFTHGKGGSSVQVFSQQTSPQKSKGISGILRHKKNASTDSNYALYSSSQQISPGDNNKNSSPESKKGLKKITEFTSTASVTSLAFGHHHNYSGSGHVKEPSSDTTSLVNSVVIREEDIIKPDVSFRRCLESLCLAVVREQNVIIELFSLAGCKPIELSQKEIIDELTIRKEALKELKIVKKTGELTGQIFSETAADVLSLVDYVLKTDIAPLPAILCIIDSYRKEWKLTFCPFVNDQLLLQLSERLSSVFELFIQEQIKAIEDTKISVKKRFGLVPFIETYPLFVRRIEAYMLPEYNDCDSRKLLDAAYDKIAKVMFELLHQVGRDANDESTNELSEGVNPAVAADDDNKEVLNFLIMMIENMHHLYNESRGIKLQCLDVHVKYCKQQYDGHLNTYTKTVIRRPLHKLLEFYEGVQDLLKTKSPEEVGYHFGYNRTALKKILAQYSGKDFKKGLDSLFKRVEKHFQDNSGLLQVVWRNVQEQYLRLHSDFEAMILKCFPGSDLHLQVTVNDLCEYFSDIAKNR